MQHQAEKFFRQFFSSFDSIQTNVRVCTDVRVGYALTLRYALTSEHGYALTFIRAVGCWDSLYLLGRFLRICWDSLYLLGQLVFVGTFFADLLRHFVFVGTKSLILRDLLGHGCGIVGTENPGGAFLYVISFRQNICWDSLYLLGHFVFVGTKNFVFASATKL